MQRDLSLHILLCDSGFQVLHLTNSVSGLWGADDIEVEMKDNVEARSDAERIKCRSLLESLKCAFLAEIKAIEQDFRLQVTMQKGENLRFKQMLSNIKSEKTYITQQLLLFQRRVDRLENEIGRD
ncbi:hypothetical protein BESB_075970 [Besnoitia besnoiti]|uniref:Uncharacterized protein n=1 Tax=Besnoitia besnoiti TaxID=94643 RepID=A0A2A9MDC4_BESBE|nr:hypothetical protein BESB_075970 [Besnoitia besnoiti]PFH33380.1 hypothetical protein BESB_075970 [Besnoitia besnoiti]